MSIVKDLHLLMMFAICIYYFFYNTSLKKELIKQKEFFIKTIEHDLRVSLIAQNRGLKLLESSEKFSAEQNEIITEVKKSVDYSLDLITTMVNTYKIENNIIKLNYELTSMSEILQTILGNLKHCLNDKRVRIKFSLSAFNILADKNFLTKAIYFLLNTALNHAFKDTIININFKNETYTKLIITYHGQPLSHEEISRMYSQNPNFTTVGFGIQMYFCKKIIEFHHGSLKFVSEKDNINTFIINLPSSMLKNKKQTLTCANLGVLQSI